MSHQRKCKRIFARALALIPAQNPLPLLGAFAGRGTVETKLSLDDRLPRKEPSGEVVILTWPARPIGV